MSEDYQNQSIPSHPTSALDSTDDRRSFTWLWIILALIAFAGAYSTYHSRQAANIPSENRTTRSDSAVNSSTGQTAPNTQAPNIEAPNTQR